MLTLFINETLDPDRALVESVLNPVPIPCPELVFGDTRLAKIVIVNGQGDVSADSGAVGSTVKVGIGILNRGEPAWLNESWTVSTSPAGWTGVIAPNIQAVEDLFNGKSIITAVLQVKITDGSSHVETYLSVPFRLIKTIIPNGALPTPPENSADGIVSIPQGSEVVIVSDLGLGAVPRQVLPFIRKPAGGDNIKPTLVDSSVTADGFQIDLDGQTPSDGYKLSYVLIF